MKYCMNCGTQMPDDAKMCPQCLTPVADHAHTDMRQRDLPKKKNKSNTVILIIMIVNLLVTFFGVYIMLKYIYKDGNVSVSDTGSGFVQESVDPICPADEYGNHDWESATCVSPSQCNNCGAYKDNKLGHHYFVYNEDIETEICWYCSMLIDEYSNSQYE